MNQLRLFLQVVIKVLAFIRGHFHFGKFWELQGRTGPDKAEQGGHH